MRLPVEKFLTALPLVLLAACAGAEGGPQPVSRASLNGPAADYPMVLGPAYAIDGVTYTPADQMNYDAVGRASLGSAGGAAVSAAHRTLPLPSYVEVTALESGRTVLVRIERRGPLRGAALLELSPGAAAELGLGATPSAPVRVRRVNPVEADRAALRAGGPAPARMDTPKSLLAVLLRKLEREEGAQSAPAASAPAVLASPPAPAPAAPRAAPPAAITKGYYVQLGAFAARSNAASLAQRSGGAISQSGGLWKVRSGPYGDEAEARRALAHAHSSGYTDARIQRPD